VWGLNVERFIKRKQEIDRWAAPRQNIWIGNLAEAGRLENLAEFMYRSPGAWSATTSRSCKGPSTRSW
jgi:hypothetical protein